MLQVFLLETLLLWILFFFITKDALAPYCVWFMMFAFASAWAVYAQSTWAFTLSERTFRVLSLAMISFALVSLPFAFARTHGKISCVTKAPTLIALPLPISLIILVLFLTMFIICYRSMAATVGSLDPFTIAAKYRPMQLAGIADMHLIARLAINIMRAGSAVFVYILINNAIAGRHYLKRCTSIVLCISLYLLITLLEGERTSTFRIIVLAVLDYGMIRGLNRKGFSLREILLGASLAFILVQGFSSIRYLIGRSSELALADYVALYFGGPIHNFDHFIRNYFGPSVTGKHTFLGLYNNLARLGIGQIQSFQREVVTLPTLRLYLGNVYTCLYDYVHDYGVTGMCILTGIYAFVINFLRDWSTRTGNHRVFRQSLYSYVATTLFFVGFTEQFYSTYLSVATIEAVLIIYFLSTMIDKPIVFVLRRPQRLNHLFDLRRSG